MELKYFLYFLAYILNTLITDKDILMSSIILVDVVVIDNQPTQR